MLLSIAMLWTYGCPHAIYYTFRKAVDHYVNNNTTVNLCLLDLEYSWSIRLDSTWSIRFDQINHSVLLIKLMKRRLPAALVKLLQYWYSIS
jgi:hypothetical protein